MTTSLKKIILNQLPSWLDKNAVTSYKNLLVSYKHSENSFIVQISGGSLNQNHKFSDNIPKPDSLQVVVNRETFIKDILRNNSNDRISTATSPKKIVIDFSSPNIAKPFHVGHLRSTIIGNFISNINKYYDNKVTKINYLGDWGTQFGVLHYGLQMNKVDVNKLHHDPIKKLYEIYVSANKLSSTDENVLKQARMYFSSIEQGKTDLDDWKKIRAVTVNELKIIYERLGLQFDEYHWESDYNGSAIKGLIASLEEQGIIETDESGKKVATVKDKAVAIMKSDNSTLYLARDIAALLDRYERYNFDKMLYVVDNAQADHFSSLFDIMKKINPACAVKCEHIKFGRIKGMSTRAGNVVFLNDILDEAKRKMHEKQKQSKNTRTSATNDETCDTLGTTAVIINDLKQRRQKDYEFDWDRALQSEGDSGIKLQYLHCRLWSLEQSCGVSLPASCDPTYIKEEIVGDVVAELAKFDMVLSRAHEECEACILVNYLFKLTRHVNRMFNELKIKNVEHDLAAQRLLVFHSARLVVKTGLEILGVKPLLEM